jgi:hypothetical protein
MFSDAMTRILIDAGMCTRPGYYSGRGAIRCDLNSTQLEKIRAGIEKEHGKKESKAFIRMVEDIPVLSATDFLITLSALEQNDFAWNKTMVSGKKGMHFESEAEAFGTVMGVFMGDAQRNETDSIRGEFLRLHNRPIAPHPYYPMEMFGFRPDRDR